MGSERLTARRLLRVILPNLPRDSAFRRLVDVHGWDWGAQEYMTADLIDVLIAANWDSKQGSPPKYLRPADRAKQKADMERREARALATLRRTRQQRGSG